MTTKVAGGMGWHLNPHPPAIPPPTPLAGGPLTLHGGSNLALSVLLIKLYLVVAGGGSCWSKTIKMRWQAGLGEPGQATVILPVQPTSYGTNCYNLQVCSAVCLGQNRTLLILYTDRYSIM